MHGTVLLMEIEGTTARRNRFQVQVHGHSAIMETSGADPGFYARGVQNFARALAHAQISGFSLIVYDYVTALPLLASR